MPLLTEEELRARISRLAAIERGSTSTGEHRAAELIAEELRELGAEVRVEEERAHGTYWWPLGIATGAAAVAGLSRSRVKAGLAALAAAGAAADDIRAGQRVLRGMLPHGTAANVVAELGSRDAPRTVVLVAHHDAAHTGRVFHPELPRAVARRFPKAHARARTTPPTMWPAVAGPLLTGAGALLGMRFVRRLGTLVSAGFALAMADIGRSPVVPGANDNLTGVATLLSVARSLRDEPVEGVRVMLVSTGSEESILEGMTAFARRHFPSLPPETTHVVCVDTVGSPRLLLLEGEGMLGMREYPPSFVALVRRCAEEIGVDLWPGLRLRNATDGMIALRAGYPTAMVGSVDRYKLPTDYHWPTDTPENVRYGSVADAARVCRAVIERLGSGREEASSGPPDAAAAQAVAAVDGNGERPAFDGRPERRQPSSTSRT